MKQKCLFEVIVVENELSNDSYKFMRREEEIIDEHGNTQTVNIIETCNENTEDSRQSEVKELVKEAKTAKELKDIMESNGFNVIAEVYNENIAIDILGKCRRAEYCDRTACAPIEMSSPTMAFYIMSLLDKYTTGLKVGTCGFRGNAGNSIMWSSNSEYKNRGKVEHFIFIFNKNKK